MESVTSTRKHERGKQVAMFVCYSSSDSFAPHTCISIISLFENNKDEKIEIYIFDLGIKAESKEIIEKVVKEYNGEVHFLHFCDSEISAYLNASLPAHHGSLATYARLCITKVFPQNVNRMLYIDSDMIITGSLREVYNSDMSGKILAAVVRKNNLSEIRKVSSEEVKILNTKGYCFNAGFMLIDIDNWRRYDFDSVIRSKISEMSEFHFKDQSILNYSIKEEQFLRLPLKYNYYLHSFPQYLIKRESKRVMPLTADEVLDARNDPIIIHYNGNQARPWYKENTSCLSHAYYKYKAISPYKDMPLESIFDTEQYKDATRIEKKLMGMLYKSYQKRWGFPLYLCNRIRIRFIQNRGGKMK